MMVCKRLGAGARAFLPWFQYDHFAWLVLDLTLTVMGEHPFLQGVGLWLDIPTPLILDYGKCAEPDLRIYADQILELLSIFHQHFQRRRA